MTHPFDPRPELRIRRPMPHGLRRLIIAALVAFFAIFVLVPWLVTFGTDWLWFRQLGLTTVYFTALEWHVILFLLGGVVSYAVLAANIRLALGRTAKSPVLFVHQNAQVAADLSRMVMRLAWIAPLVIAFMVGLFMASDWMTYAQAFHAATVGTTDPIFGRDLGFYLFHLPALSTVLGIAVGLVVLSLGGAGLVYVLRGQLPLGAHHGTADRGAERHLASLAAVLFLLVAVQLWIVSSANLLYSTTGPLVGASYTDVHVSLPGIRLSAIAALVAIGLVIYGAMRGRLLRQLAIAVAIYAAVGIVARGLVPLAVQRLVVLPNELTKETPYLQDHIAATRAAWGLTNVQTRQLSGEATLTMADIKSNAPTINNVRLWERDLLQQTFKQLQEIRTYYDFVSVNDDRYMIDGDYRQVHLSVRELNAASLPTQTFINNRLTFTHGMGVTMAPVNQVTDEGLPVLFIKDLPPVSTVGIKLTRPEIYYGQAAESYVFVNTKQKEFDYPSGDQNIYTSYPGTGGVPVGSFLRRALYAMQFGSMQILFSDDIAGNARVMYHRNIMERASTALPFLTFDAEPYIVITDDGRLVWVLDGYTTSSGYPYSKPVDDIDYMRNSVKVTIDAYNGAVTAYVADSADPVIRTYENIFAGIFKPISAMPADVQEAHAVPRAIVPHAGVAAGHVSHGRPRRLLPPRGSVGHPRGVGPRKRHYRVHAAHDHAAARRAEGRVHLHDAVHAAREGQSRGVDGGADGRLALWRVARVPVPEAELGVRAQADREPDQSGHRHLASDHVVGSARLGGDSRRAVGDSDSGIADLRAAAVSARVGRVDSGDEARGGGERRSRGDGRDAGPGAHGDVRRRPTGGGDGPASRYGGRGRGDAA